MPCSPSVPPLLPGALVPSPILLLPPRSALAASHGGGDGAGSGQEEAEGADRSLHPAQPLPGLPALLRPPYHPLPAAPLPPAGTLAVARGAERLLAVGQGREAWGQRRPVPV